MQAKRSKKKAKEIIHEKLEDQYHKLVHYEAWAWKTNQNTIVAIMETNK